VLMNVIVQASRGLMKQTCGIGMASAINKLPPKICPIPWIGIEATPMGTCRPCCLAKDEIPGIDLRHNTLTEAFHSDYMKELRSKFLDGEQPETCKRCWDEEAAGKQSKRINTQIRLKHYMDEVQYDTLSPDNMMFLDLKLGNICNLKCRICGSWSSSKWAKEEIDQHQGDKNHIAYKFLFCGSWPENNDQFWDDLQKNIEHIRYMEITGGEPLLIPRQHEFIKYIDSAGYAKNIEIHYNTNASQNLNLNLYKNFKKVEFALSIDNVGKRLEYERYGLKWDDTIHKLPKELHDFNSYKRDNTMNIDIQLCFTINIQNVYYIDKLLLWADDSFDSIHWNYLHDPNYMCVQYMTDEAKELVLSNIYHHQTIVLPQYKDDFEQLAEFIRQGPGSDGTDFVEYMRRTDEYRSEDFRELYPEIAKAMGYV